MYKERGLRIKKNISSCTLFPEKHLQCLAINSKNYSISKYINTTELLEEIKPSNEKRKLLDGRVVFLAK